jgi:hypothetical protein
LCADQDYLKVSAEGRLDGIHGVAVATLSTRLCAVSLGVALVFAQLLCGIHKAEAAGHKPGQACDLCLSVANLDHGLIDAVTLQVPCGSVVNDRPPWRVPRVALTRECRARSPPSRLLPLVW